MANGRFLPGQSGNPSGRPREFPEVKDAARAWTLAAIKRLAAIMQHGEDERAAVAAANALLDRGWGKPAATIEIDARHQFAGEDMVLVTSAYPALPSQALPQLPHHDASAEPERGQGDAGS